MEYFHNITYYDILLTFHLPHPRQTKPNTNELCSGQFCGGKVSLDRTTAAAAPPLLPSRPLVPRGARQVSHHHRDRHGLAPLQPALQAVLRFEHGAPDAAAASRPLVPRGARQVSHHHLDRHGLALLQLALQAVLRFELGALGRAPTPSRPPR